MQMKMFIILKNSKCGMNETNSAIPYFREVNQILQS